MLTPRLEQSSGSAPNHYQVQLSFGGDGGARRTVDADFEFKLSDQDQSDLRWYLEDYLQAPLDPAPNFDARVEQRIAEIGAELFRDIFEANDAARKLWAALREKLNETRVEISSGVSEAASIPWELLRDPKTNVRLALRAQSFVRAQPQAAQRPRIPAAGFYLTSTASSVMSSYCSLVP